MVLIPHDLELLSSCPQKAPEKLFLAYFSQRTKPCQKLRAFPINFPPPKDHFLTPPLPLLCNQVLRGAWGTVGGAHTGLQLPNGNTSSTQSVDHLFFNIHPPKPFFSGYYHRITTDLCPLKGKAFAAGGTQRLQGSCLE